MCGRRLLALAGVVQVVAERVAEPEEAGGHPVEAARQGPVLEHPEQQGFLLDRQCYGSRRAGILEHLGDPFGAFGPAQLLEQYVAAGPWEPDVGPPPPRSVAILMCSSRPLMAGRLSVRGAGIGVESSPPERNWAQRLAEVARGFHPVPDRSLPGAVQVVLHRVVQRLDPLAGILVGAGRPVEPAAADLELENLQQHIDLLFSRELDGPRGSDRLENLASLDAKVSLPGTYFAELLKEQFPSRPGDRDRSAGEVDADLVEAFGQRRLAAYETQDACDGRANSREGDRCDVRRGARPAGVAADRGHRGVLAVLACGLDNAALPDGLHAPQSNSGGLSAFACPHARRSSPHVRPGPPGLDGPRARARDTRQTPLEKILAASRLRNPRILERLRSARVSTAGNRTRP